MRKRAELEEQLNNLPCDVRIVKVSHRENGKQIAWWFEAMCIVKKANGIESFWYGDKKYKNVTQLLAYVLGEVKSRCNV